MIALHLDYCLDLQFFGEIQDCTNAAPFIITGALLFPEVKIHFKSKIQHYWRTWKEIGRHSFTWYQKRIVIT